MSNRVDDIDIYLGRKDWGDKEVGKQGYNQEFRFELKMPVRFPSGEI